MRIFQYTLLVATLASFAAGCASTTEQAVKDHYQPAALATAAGLEAAKLLYVPTSQTPAAQVAQASFDESPLATEPARVLRVTYPHHSGDADKATAELVVQPTHPGQSSSKRLARFGKWLDRSLPGVATGDDGTTAYRLTLTKAEVDALLRQLAAEGKFEATADDDHTSPLLVSINGTARHLPVGRDLTLDRLVARVENEGELVSIHDEHIVSLVEQGRPAAERDQFYDTLLR
jgi:hypothetical protein